jgi:sialate O-acetylesterase
MNKLYLDISSQNKWQFFLQVTLVLFPVFGFSQIQLAKIFSDNMVLQRNEPIKIWGKAKPGHTVIVVFANDKRITTVQHDSGWTVTFKAQQASTHPQSALITSRDEKIEIKNIVIGDIWLRLYNPVYAGKNTYSVLFTDSIIKNLTTEKFYNGQWQTCDSNSIKTMSAVAYYFGKEIVTETNIPVGLIHLSIGGAPLETFISTTALKNNKQFSLKLNGDWLLNAALPVWIKERGRQNVGGLNNVSKDEYGNNHAFKPGFAYESGIAPILNLPIKGIICYQGESNAQEMMVDDYRKKWKQQALPFYFVQLSSIDTVKYKGHLWPQFRDEQRKMLQIISNIGMAVCSDIGARDDVHPTNKKLVGERLARWCLSKTYDKKVIVSGPLPLSAKYFKGKVVISFQHIVKGLKTLDDKPLKGFSIDGKTETEAIVGDKDIIIPISNKPQFIYYGWSPFNNGNLANSENLPASTFKIKVQ